MLRIKPKATGRSLPAKAISGIGAATTESACCEMRPGGMLVQKRNSDSSQISTPIPTMRVRIKYGSYYHEINISSQASFGDLKKMLAGPTGLHPLDQKLMYKERERDSKVFLDIAGVKDGSKMVLVEDVMSRERRCLESRKNAKMDKAMKEIAEIRLEVDKLAKQVESLESDVIGGKKVAETVLLNSIELLMTQLIKLDGIVAEGDVKLQRRLQVKRVQKYIETLDMLKMRNSMLGNNRVKIPLQLQKIPNGQMPKSMQKQDEQRKQGNFSGQSPGPVVVTTKWETFDSSLAVKVPSTLSSTGKHVNNASARLNWELFE